MRPKKLRRSSSAPEAQVPLLQDQQQWSGSGSGGRGGSELGRRDSLHEQVSSVMTLVSTKTSRHIRIGTTVTSSILALFMLAVGISYMDKRACPANESLPLILLLLGALELIRVLISGIFEGLGVREAAEVRVRELTTRFRNEYGEQIVQTTTIRDTNGHPTKHPNDWLIFLHYTSDFFFGIGETMLGILGCVVVFRLYNDVDFFDPNDLEHYCDSFLYWTTFVCMILQVFWVFVFMYLYCCLCICGCGLLAVFCCCSGST